MAAASLPLLKTTATALLLLCLISAGVRQTAARVYKVGDAGGWTIGGKTNYTTWASTKTFHVGDTIVFEYSKEYHNVLEVTKANYEACNTKSPIATRASGYDSIEIERPGHYFFICGFPGHCGLGQKVDIRVVRPTPAATPSPAPSPSPAPAPIASSAHHTMRGVGFALSVVGAAAIYSIIMP